MYGLLKYQYYLYAALLGGVLIWYATSPHASTPALSEQGYVSDATMNVERTFSDTQDLGLSDISSSSGLTTNLPNLPKLTWETAHIASNKPDEHVDLEYPKFSGGPEVEALNSYIEHTIRTYLTHDSDPVLLTPADDEPSVYAESGGTNIASRYRVVGVRNTTVSLELVASSFTYGGNGDHSESILINWDLKKGAPLTDTELLCPGQTIESLTGPARDALTTPTVSGRTPGEGTFTNGVPFSEEGGSFLLPSSGLILVFKPYAVASGASGIMRVLLPEKSVKNILCVP